MYHLSMVGHFQNQDRSYSGHWVVRVCVEGDLVWVGLCVLKLAHVHVQRSFCVHVSGYVHVYVKVRCLP